MSGHFSIIKDETVRILADFKNNKIIDLTRFKQPQNINNITAQDDLSAMLAKAQEKTNLTQKIAEQKQAKKQAIINKMRSQFLQVKNFQTNNAQKAQFWLAYLSNKDYQTIWEDNEQIALQQQALLTLANIAPQNMQQQELVKKAIQLKPKLEQVKLEIQAELARQAKQAKIPKSYPKPQYTNNSNGTVTDKRTSLMWMRCSLGQIWTGSTCSGSAKGYEWDNAKNLSTSFAGYDDWRTPSIVELNTLVYCSNGKQLKYKEQGYDTIKHEGSMAVKVIHEAVIKVQLLTKLLFQTHLPGLLVVIA